MNLLCVRQALGEQASLHDTVNEYIYIYIYHVSSLAGLGAHESFVIVHPAFWFKLWQLSQKGGFDWVIASGVDLLRWCPHHGS